MLDADHYGLEDVKDRILESLAVMQLNKEAKAPIICLVGPPGVGKTSLGQSIARAMGRKFERLSLGGLHDEAELRGHRRTYIGAMPGRMIQAIRRAGVSNPLLMLDEIDKLGRDFRGDPAAALMEILDPAQNKEFRDNYLNLPFDLSKVFFITTANTLEGIPRPLLDRMEVMDLTGYSDREKREIARRYLIPRQRVETGLEEGQLDIPDDVLTLDHPPLHARSRRARTRTRHRAARAQARPSGARKAQRQPVGADHGRYIDDAGRPDALPVRQRSRNVAGRRCGGTRVDRSGRRRAVHRSDPDASRRTRDADGPTRQRDAGVGKSGAQLHLVGRRKTRHRSQAHRKTRRAHPRAGGRGAERRSVRGYHDGDGARLRVQRTADPRRISR